MEIYIIPFIICLAVAFVPFLIQLLICMASKKLWVRLVPAIVSAALILVWAYHILQGLIPGTPYMGYALDWMLWQCMCAALVIAHGVPFLILGRKK